MGDYASDNGVAISLIVFQKEQANVGVIGILQQKTSGLVDRVNPKNKINSFDNVLKEDIIATNASI